MTWNFQGIFITIISIHNITVFSQLNLVLGESSPVQLEIKAIFDDESEQIVSDDSVIVSLNTDINNGAESEPHEVYVPFQPNGNANHANYVTFDSTQLADTSVAGGDDINFKIALDFENDSGNDQYVYIQEVQPNKNIPLIVSNISCSQKFIVHGWDKICLLTCIFNYLV